MVNIDNPTIEIIVQGFNCTLSSKFLIIFKSWIEKDSNYYQNDISPEKSTVTNLLIMSIPMWFLHELIVESVYILDILWWSHFDQ